MNEQYLKRMQDMLKEEYPAYIEQLDSPAKKGMRINPLKVSSDDFLSSADYVREKSPFAANGYYADFPSGIGYTVEHMSGFFYIQEPSASSAVTIMDPKPGMYVLDMCAAPGSKSTQIAEMLWHSGLLVANEIHSARARILLENIERHGAANVMVLNSAPQEVAKTFPDFFDMVLCDAPCSGEGMFRKEDQAMQQWSMKNVEACAVRQTGILEDAYRCLRPGGTLVYSTCTFAIEENEQCILNFLKRHADMHMISSSACFGRPAFELGENTSYARRIFPMDHGEGHFIAKMRKDGDKRIFKKTLISPQIPKEARVFLDDFLVKQYPYYYFKNNKLYGGTEPFYEFGKCRILRHQVLLGEMEKNRFVPDHALFMSAYTCFRRNISLDKEEVYRYLHGEQLPIKADKGWYALSYQGVVIGGAKSDGSVLKNKYPKHLRLR